MEDKEYYGRKTFLNGKLIYFSIGIMGIVEIILVLLNINYNVVRMCIVTIISYIVLHILFNKKIVSKYGPRLVLKESTLITWNFPNLIEIKYVDIDELIIKKKDGDIILVAKMVESSFEEYGFNKVKIVSKFVIQNDFDEIIENINNRIKK